VFRNKLVFALLALFVIVAIALATINVSAGEGTGGHLGDIIAPLFV
jgi:hypothetical protein